MSARTKILFTAAYLLYVLWIMLLASVPPVSRDALTHHLAVPKLWVEGETFRLFSSIDPEKCWANDEIK